MLKKETLEIVEKLLEIDITKIIISEDTMPVHESSKREKNPTTEYCIKVDEILYHHQIQNIDELLAGWDNINMKFIPNEGLEIYEMESE